MINNAYFLNKLKNYSKVLESQGLTMDLNYKDRGTSSKKSSNKKDLEEIKKLITMSPEIKKKTKTSNVSRAMNLLDDIINEPKKKVYKNDMKDVEDIIKEVEKLSKKKPKALKKLVKADKEHIKYHPSEQDKKEAKVDEASLLLSPYKYKNMTLIDQIAESLKNPEFEGIKKKKILNSYSYDTITKFNKKYHDLMIKLFKTEDAVEKILKKKADKLEKNNLSEIKKIERTKKYSEKAKEKRKENKNKKYKHIDDLTDAELKKFKQAKNYYMRKSKDSTILPKGLNKSDLEGLNGVCRDLAVDGFDTMSEHLFMKYYEG
jgi:hypothetical protein